MQSFYHGVYKIDLIGKSVFVYRDGRRIFAASLSDYLEFARTNRLLIDYLKIKAKDYEQPTK